jgi:hypothetical protein
MTLLNSAKAGVSVQLGRAAAVEETLDLEQVSYQWVDTEAGAHGVVF